MDPPEWLKDARLAYEKTYIIGGLKSSPPDLKALTHLPDLKTLTYTEVDDEDVDAEDVDAENVRKIKRRMNQGVNYIVRSIHATDGFPLSLRHRPTDNSDNAESEEKSDSSDNSKTEENTGPDKVLRDAHKLKPPQTISTTDSIMAVDDPNMSDADAEEVVEESLKVMMKQRAIKAKEWNKKQMQYNIDAGEKVNDERYYTRGIIMKIRKCLRFCQKQEEYTARTEEIANRLNKYSPAAKLSLMLSNKDKEQDPNDHDPYDFDDNLGMNFGLAIVRLKLIRDDAERLLIEVVEDRKQNVGPKDVRFKRFMETIREAMTELKDGPVKEKLSETVMDMEAEDVTSEVTSEFMDTMPTVEED